MPKIVINGEAVELGGAINNVEEYDTETGGTQWHIRKWSNGYCEFMGKKQFSNIPITTAFGESLFLASNITGSSTSTQISGIPLPFALTEKITEQVTIANATATLGLLGGVPGSSYNPLTTVGFYNVFRGIKADAVSFVLEIYVFGRWKQADNIVSMLPARGIELPAITATASSAIEQI